MLSESQSGGLGNGYSTDTKTKKCEQTGLLVCTIDSQGARFENTAFWPKQPKFKIAVTFVP